MNEEQLKAAAIALCEIRGLDPFEHASTQVCSKWESNDDGTNSIVYSERKVERWEFFTAQIKEHEEIREAVIRAIAGNGWTK